MNNDTNKDIYLVDGSAYIFRAYHALPPLTNPEGVVVNAVLGFTNMMVKLLNEMEAPYIAVIFDAARKNFRNDIYADYKANRDETPDDLKPKFPLIRDCVRAFGMEPIEMEGFEADDLIATYARIGEEQGRKVTIVSSDKDLMQLVTDNVRMFDPMKNKMMGEAEVLEKFGVKPNRVVDIQALAGDAVDNVPGVPGIGVKTAAQLINEYGDLETLLARAGEIKQPKRREKLIGHADDARVSMRLVSLDAHVDVPYDLDDLKVHDTNTETLANFLGGQGFNSALKRLGRAPVTNTSTNTQLTTNNFPPIDKNEYTCIQDVQTLQKWIDEAKKTGILAFDTETTALTPSRAELVGISIASTVGKAAYIPLAHKSGEPDLLDPTGGVLADQIPMETAIATLKPILEDPSVLKIAQNAKYDWQILMAHDIDVSPIDDTMMISYVLEAGAHGHGMDELSQLYFDHKPIPYKEVAGTGKSQVTFDMVPLDKAIDYAAEDADITLRLWHELKPTLEAERLTSVYENLDRPLIPVIGRMEMAGITVDRNILRDMSNQFATELLSLEKEIQDEAGSPFNISSPKQVGQILFDQMGLQGGKKTKTGDWSTNVSILEDLATANPIVQKILDYRGLAKLKSTYTDALQTQIIERTGRVHTSFSLAGTSTGRLASSDPNLQNIPIRTEAGRKIRTAFIAPKGKTIVAIDYSQVELRLVAAMADIPRLKKAFIDGHDIHAITASEVFGVPLDQMDGETRRKAKAINFGIIYGISGFGLAKQLNIEPGEAGQYIKLYFKRFPELSNFMEETKAIAHDMGYVETLYNRRAWIRGIHDKNHAIKSGAERAAINAPVQGTAADIMKHAMIKIDNAIQNGEIDAKMLLQVHDELIFEIDDEKVDLESAKIKDIMENILDIDVPLIVEAGAAKNWAQAH
jgi:DNA polymerase-1